MPVPVMGVGHVRVIMHERRMAVGVSVGCLGRIVRAVLVLMVLVVNVKMLVL